MLKKRDVFQESIVTETCHVNKPMFYTLTLSGNNSILYKTKDSEKIYFSSVESLYKKYNRNLSENNITIFILFCKYDEIYKNVEYCWLELDSFKQNSRDKNYPYFIQTFSGRKFVLNSFDNNSLYTTIPTYRFVRLPKLSEQTFVDYEIIKSLTGRESSLSTETSDSSIKLSDYVGYVIGMYLSNGYIKHGCFSVMIQYFNISDLYMLKYLGMNYIKLEYIKKNGATFYEYCIISKSFKSFIIKNIEFGLSKRIPDEALSCSVYLVRGIIRGLFNNNENVCYFCDEISIRINNSKMLDNISILFYRLGIMRFVSYQNTNDCFYTIVIKDSSDIKLLKSIIYKNISDEYKNKDSDNFYYDDYQTNVYIHKTCTVSYSLSVKNEDKKDTSNLSLVLENGILL